MKYCEKCEKKYDPEHGGCDCDPEPADDVGSSELLCDARRLLEEAKGYFGCYDPDKMQVWCEECNDLIKRISDHNSKDRLQA